VELIFRFSLLNVAHNSLDISNVAINIKFPLAACIVHITYFPKNRSLFPTLKSKPEGLVDATYYVNERLTRTIPSFIFFFYRRDEYNYCRKFTVQSTMEITHSFHSKVHLYFYLYQLLTMI